ncbi:MAG: SGNH/GDSL hydrolase family protein [Colwellia sp.]|nr:SGNH/GDSL hydrolase family protein [Colwellia sp.]
MKAYHNTAVLKFDDETTGNAASGALVTIRLNSTQALSDIFDLDDNAIANPLTCNSKGNYSFKAADDIYDIIISENTANEEKLEKVEIIELVSALNVDINAIALANNVFVSEVIYSTDTLTILDDVLFIHDEVNQKTWIKPRGIGVGAVIISLVGDQLTVTGPFIFTVIRAGFGEYLVSETLKQSSKPVLNDVITLTEKPRAKDVDAAMFRIASGSNMQNETSDDFNFHQLNSGLIASPIGSVREGVEASVNTHIFDMRAISLKHTGWVNTEPGGTTQTTINSIGERILNLVDASAFVIGQLIAYEQNTGRFDSAVIISIAINTLTLKHNTSDVKIGGICSNFYSNDAHPNPTGYTVIADAALQSIKFGGNVFHSSLEDLQSISGATLAVITTNAPSKPPQPYYTVESEVVETRTFENTGTVQIEVTTGATVAGRVFVYAREFDETTSSLILLGSTVNAGGVNKLVVNYTSAYGKKWVVRVDSDVQYNVGKIDIRKADSQFRANNGVHVFFGDSWFNQIGIKERVGAMLPSATIINEAISGNNSANLLARFDSDVPPNKPDYVWLNCSTNDLVGSVTSATFNANMKGIIRKIKAIGATPIVFTGWVAYEPFFDASCDYYQLDYIRDSIAAGSDDGDVVISYDETIAAGEEKIIYAGDKTDKDMWVKSALHPIDGNSFFKRLVFGFSNDIELPVFNTVEFVTTALIEDPADKIKIRSTGIGSDRFFIVSYKNTSGVSLQLQGSIRIGQHLRTREITL